jgi:cytochrome oxidase Cu insertion factor (SCO1/SenC/PrrC family)
MEAPVIWRAILLALTVAGTSLHAQEVFDKPDPVDDNMQTGVAVGERIPTFEAPDQNGRSWTFDTIKGPKGAVLLFYRSADW